MTNFNELKGKTIISVQGLLEGSKEVIFECSDGTKYTLANFIMCNAQCCHYYTGITSITGDINNILGNVVVNVSDELDDEFEAKYSYNAIKITSDKGHVVIIFSYDEDDSGYYLQELEFEKINP